MDHHLKERRAIVVGASRGLGRGVALALAEAGAQVLAIGRDAAALDDLKRHCGERIDIRAVDATDASVAARTMNHTDADALFLIAGATPVMRRLPDYRWESFSENWNTDVKLTFHWLQEAVNQPMRAGSRVVVFSSGAALHGSPMSGGYAPAKQAQRTLCDYMRGELQALGRDIIVQCVMPQLNPNTALGLEAVLGYSRRTGEEPAAYVRKRFGDSPLTPALAGSEMVRLLADEGLRQPAEFVLTGAGLKPMHKAANGA